MTTFEEISSQINALKRQIAALREAGARAAADEKMTGGEVMLWLTRNGMDSGAARQLCVTIIRERRAANAEKVRP